MPKREPPTSHEPTNLRREPRTKNEHVERIRVLRRNTIPELRKLLRLAEAEEKFLRLRVELEDVDVDKEVERINQEREEIEEEESAIEDESFLEESFIEESFLDESFDESIPSDREDSR